MKMVRRSGLLWITRSKDIRLLKKRGEFSRGNTILAWRSPNEEAGAGIPTVGVTAGRGFKGAVQRNRAKRRLREAVLENRSVLDPAHKYIIEARPGTETKNFHILVKECNNLLLRING